MIVCVGRAEKCLESYVTLRSDNYIDYEAENGIIFLFDPALRKVDVPAYIVGETVSVSQNCASISTRVWVDGAVKMRLSEYPPEPNLHKVFDGEIIAPSAEVCLVSPENHPIVCSKLREKFAKFAVWVDDPRNASIVCVQLL